MTEASPDTVVPAVPGFWSYAHLGPSSIRWYWNRTPLSLKGIYQQDILHRAHLQRFCQSDSLQLEDAYRERQEELERSWWEEEAELSTSSAAKANSEKSVPDVEASSVTWQDYFLGAAAEDQIQVLARGGLYEADLLRRRLKACYWPEDAHRILRGTWFVDKSPDWVPLKEATADELEEAYRSEIWNPSRGRLQAHKLGFQAARVDLRTLTNEAKGWFALFVSEGEAYLCRDDSFSWLSRKLASSSSPGMRLRRGWEPPAEGVTVQEADPQVEETEEAAAKQPVNRLLLVVHGIGQNLTGSNIAADAAGVRNNLRSLAAEHLSEEERASGRTEVLPVQWRKHLTLDVDSLADAIMPPGVRALRQMLHATAVEVLLYLTQLHCQDMLDALVDSLNLQFHKFQRRNPGFDGTVSIMAHSLGSVLTYDILCNQPHLFASLKSCAKEHADSAVGPTSTSGEAGDASLDLQPFSSHDLDPSLPGQDDSLFRSGAQVSSGTSGTTPIEAISSDLIDLTGLTSTPQPSAAGSEAQVHRLQEENTRLRLELAALRQASSRGASTSEATGAQDTLAEAGGQMAPPVRIKPLAFAVDRLFLAGSPLGIFLALRSVNPGKGRGLGTPQAAQLMLGSAHTAGDGLPAVKRMFNVYHPFDPVGFRLEPLVTVGAEKRRPIYVPTFRGGRRLHVGLTELGEDVSAAMSAGAARASSIFQSSLSSLKLSAMAMASSVKKADSKEPAAEESKLSAEEEAEEAGVQQASQGTQSAIWRLTDGRGEALEASNSRSAQGRLDFVLQATNLESPYLSAISSHFAYWTNADMGLFILRALHHRDVKQGAPKEPTAAKAQPASTETGSPPPANPPQAVGIAMGSQGGSPVRCVQTGAPGDVLSPKAVQSPLGLSDPEDWW